MTERTPGPIRLLAVVAADEAQALRAPGSRLRLVVCGPVAAVVADPGAANEPEPRAALRHDRVVGRALAACSSVVPFRLGVELPSGAELHHVLEENRVGLLGQLARFRGRVEMGLKAKLAARAPDASDEPARLPPGLERVRALAPHGEDRRERRRRAPRQVTGQVPGEIFAGCYLIPRPAIHAFWSALAAMRRTRSDLPLLGSGPWAAYSFCDFSLRPARRAARVAGETENWAPARSAGRVAWAPARSAGRVAMR